MKKTALILSVMLTAALLGMSVVPAGSQQPAEVVTIEVFDPNKTDYEKHVRGSGDPFAPGDWHVFVDRLLDPETCEVAAKIVGRFTFVKKVGKFNGWLINDWTATLPDGRITGYGAARYADFAKEDPVFAVTGGTGAYSGVGGELSFATVPESRCGTKGTMSTLTLKAAP